MDHNQILKQILFMASVLAVSASLPVGAGASEAEKDDNRYDLNENTQPVLRKGIDLQNLPRDMDLLFPLSPEEKLEIRQRQLEDQEATYKPLRNVEPIRELVQVSANADTIPEIKVTPDSPTSVVFTDITGAPWPISYIGQTTSLATIEQPSGTSNSLVIYAKNSAGRKSVSVFLEGLTLPVTMTISGSSGNYHALKHIRVTERGPNSQTEDVLLASRGQTNTAQTLNPTGQSEEGSSNLDMILNKLAYKVTPEGFKKLKSSDRSVDAWIEIGKPKYMYVMTDYNLVSPGPRAGGRGVTPLQDGVRIYIIPRINPVMALNNEGSRVYLTFKE